MGWREYLPVRGDKRLRDKINDLEREAGSIVIMFGVTAGKVIEQLALLKWETVLVHLFAFDPVAAWRAFVALGWGPVCRFSVASLALAGWYVRREARKVASDAVDEATE